MRKELDGNEISVHYYKEVDKFNMVYESICCIRDNSMDVK